MLSKRILVEDRMPSAASPHATSNPSGTWCAPHVNKALDNDASTGQARLSECCNPLLGGRRPLPTGPDPVAGAHHARRARGTRGESHSSPQGWCASVNDAARLSGAPVKDAPRLSGAPVNDAPRVSAPPVKDHPRQPGAPRNDAARLLGPPAVDMLLWRRASDPESHPEAHPEPPALLLHPARDPARMRSSKDAPIRCLHPSGAMHYCMNLLRLEAGCPYKDFRETRQGHDSHLCRCSCTRRRPRHRRRPQQRPGRRPVRQPAASSASQGCLLPHRSRNPGQGANPRPCACLSARSRCDQTRACRVSCCGRRCRMQGCS